MIAHHYNRATLLDLLSAANDAVGVAMKAISDNDIDLALNYAKHGATIMKQAAAMIAAETNGCERKEVAE